jgi:hypothetical protein
MFRVGDTVEIISERRIGKINKIHWHKQNALQPDAIEVVDSCVVRFGNDIPKDEVFKPEQLRLVK